MVHFSITFFRNVQEDFETWGKVIVGVGPVGIAHNLLEGVYGHAFPENFSILSLTAETVLRS